MKNSVFFFVHTLSYSQALIHIKPFSELNSIFYSPDLLIIIIFYQYFRSYLIKKLKINNH